LEKLRQRIQQFKEKRPGYGGILDLYQKVREAQKRAKSSLRIDPIQLKKEWKDLLAREGFSLLQRQDFPLDIEASVILFQALCQIGKDANPHMAEQVRKIEELLNSGRIDLKELMRKGIREQGIEQIADEFGLDRKVLLFLIEESARPSVEAGMEQLRTELDPENWPKGYCPICGSLPLLSLLRGEVGKKYLLCSFCGYQWRIDRLICPFCNNKDQESLHYLYAEGEEAYRIDLCEKCHQYIKTIDLRKVEDSDPCLEDLATLHLDILVSKKGYKKPAPSVWTI
jgi:FdhE protein